MRVGLVCPYTWDVPGGVQAHVRDLAEALITLGHQVSVLTPSAEDAELPAYAESAGRAIPIPYNGSVARLLLGPVSATRVRRWLKDGGFDVLHIHEPLAPSISLLASWLAFGPVVATFHSANPRSKAITAALPFLLPALEKLTGKIAVSAAARRTVAEHLGGDPVLIPNGVTVARYAGAEPYPGQPDGRSLLFLGRIDEPRKGLDVLLGALPEIMTARPDVRLNIAGPGDLDGVRAALHPSVADRVELLGLVTETDKHRLLASTDLYVAPNLGGESFGIVLLEAMAAGAPVLASDLDAFTRVLDGGSAGRLFPTGDPRALAAAALDLLGNDAERHRLRAAGQQAVAPYDWPTVAKDVVAVYETVIEGAAGTGRRGVDLDPDAPDPEAIDPDAIDTEALDTGERRLSWRLPARSGRLVRRRPPDPLGE